MTLVWPLAHEWETRKLLVGRLAIGLRENALAGTRDCICGSDDTLARRLFRRRLTWSAASIWTCLVAAIMLGIAAADPEMNAPAVISSLGLIWIGVFASILLIGQRMADVPDPNAVSPSDLLDLRSGEQTVLFADAAMAMIDQKCRLRVVNDRLCEILGRSPSELLGKQAWDFVSPEDHERFGEQVRCRRQGVSGMYEFRCLRPDGEVRWLLAAVHPVYDRFGKYAGGLGLLSDITEKKRAEAAVHAQVAELDEMNRKLKAARAEAEAALVVRDQFLANVTHELRTPLTAILGYAETLLVEGDISQAPPVRLGAIQTIIRNGQYLLRIVNDLLDIARMEAGHLSLEQQAFSPAQLAADVLSLLRVKADAKGLPLLLELRPPLPRLVRSDPFRVRQILINLLGNAVKFTETGSVRLIVKAIQDENADCSLHFDVIDTGVGIPASQVDRVFEPFHQVEGGASWRYGGTGLGLTISRALARRLGGDISVVSEEGVGSSFRLALPVGKAAELDWESSPSANLELAAPADTDAFRVGEAQTQIQIKARVLLAEDAPDTRRLLIHILQKAGVEVEPAQDGKEAIQTALQAMREGRPFDCILMDMQMPGMDGYQATQVLRESGYNSPIIALTANAGPGDRTRCLEAGCDGFAAKPLSREKLLRLVAKYAAECRPVPAVSNS